MMRHYYEHFTNNTNNKISDGLKVITFKQTYTHYEKRFGNKHKECSDFAYYRLRNNDEQKSFKMTFSQRLTMNNRAFKLYFNQFQYLAQAGWRLNPKLFRLCLKKDI